MIISLQNLTNDSEAVDILINDYHDNNSNYGIRIKKAENTKGHVTLNNVVLENNKLNGIRMTDAYNSDLAININKPRILNCNTEDSEDTNVAGISMTIIPSDTKGIGNIHIVEPYITNHYSGSRYIVSRGNSNVKNQNISLLNPLNNDGKNITFIDTDNIIFEDRNKMFIVNPIGRNRHKHFWWCFKK